MPNYISKCCKAPMTVSSSDEGTNYMVCDKCGKPCDWKEKGKHLIIKEILDKSNYVVKEAKMGQPIKDKTIKTKIIVNHYRSVVGSSFCLFVSIGWKKIGANKITGDYIVIPRDNVKELIDKLKESK